MSALPSYQTASSKHKSSRQSKSLAQALDWAKLNLTADFTSTPVIDAEILLAYSINKTREFIFTYPEYLLSSVQFNIFKKLITKRRRGFPIAYLIGTKEFYGHNFVVSRDVLIPRPESEQLIEETLKIVKPKSIIADIGTGSGCLAIVLAIKLPQSKIFATDTSKAALKIAKKNNRLNRTKVIFLNSDLASKLEKKSIDVIVANLPYGWQQWKNNTAIDSRGLKFEPPKALFSAERGLAHYHMLFKQIAGWSNQPGYILCEFDPRQTNEITKLAKKIFPAANLIIKKDLAKLNRILLIKL